jgi:hypothetical protein
LPPARCWPISGAPNVTAFEPTSCLQTEPRRLASEPSITEYSLRALLQSPHETMPHIKFTPDQLDDIIGYILSFKSRHQRPDSTRSTLAR